MDWLTGGKTGEAKRLIAQLADATKRDVAARDLIGLNADAVPALLEALQTRDLNLLAIYEQILPKMTKTMHPQPQPSFDPPGCGKSTLRHIVAGTLSQFDGGSLMNVKKIVHGVMAMAKCCVTKAGK